MAWTSRFFASPAAGAPFEVCQENKLRRCLVVNSTNTFLLVNDRATTPTTRGWIPDSAAGTQFRLEISYSKHGDLVTAQWLIQVAGLAQISIWEWILDGKLTDFPDNRDLTDLLKEVKHG